LPNTKQGGVIMAKGQKYNDDIKEKAYALLAFNNNVSFVAEK